MSLERKNCMNCGTDIPDNMNICYFCGESPDEPLSTEETLGIDKYDY